MQGASTLRIIVKSIMPMCIPSVLVRITLSMASVILTAAGLGFLGLGAQPPLPEWGAMIATGRNYMLDSWWLVTFPGRAILLVSLAFNLLGDGFATHSIRSARSCVVNDYSNLLDVQDLQVSYKSDKGMWTPFAACRSSSGRRSWASSANPGPGNRPLAARC